MNIITEHSIESVKKERLEQIDKHNYTLQKDQQYTNGELVKAAQYCLTLQGWPLGWRMEDMNRIALKSYEERVKIAAAFLIAELDRIAKKELIEQAQGGG